MLSVVSCSPSALPVTYHSPLTKIWPTRPPALNIQAKYWPRTCEHTNSGCTSNLCSYLVLCKLYIVHQWDVFWSGAVGCRQPELFAWRNLQQHQARQVSHISQQYIFRTWQFGIVVPASLCRRRPSTRRPPIYVLTSRFSATLPLYSIVR